MKTVFFSSLAACALTAGPAFAAEQPINYQTINNVFHAIAAEVVKAEQVRGPKGEDLIDSIKLNLDTTLTSISARRIALDGSVTVNSSAWKPGQKSAFSVNVTAAAYDAALYPPLGSFDAVARIRLSTDVTAFVAFASKRWISDDDPCSQKSIQSGKTPKEVDYNRAACIDLMKLPYIKNLSELFGLTANVLTKRITYVTDRMGELDNRKPEEQREAISLQNELKFDTKILNRIQNRAVADKLDFSIREDLALGGNTMIKDVYLQIEAGHVELSLSLDSPESTILFDQAKKDIERWARVLERDDSDAEKKKLVGDIRETLKFAVAESKGYILFGKK